jgi:hypothetical protein
MTHMKFVVTIQVDAKELRETHEGLDADERQEAVRADIEEAIEALSYAVEVNVTE